LIVVTTSIAFAYSHSALSSPSHSTTISLTRDTSIYCVPYHTHCNTLIWSQHYDWKLQHSEWLDLEKILDEFTAVTLRPGSFPPCLRTVFGPLLFDSKRTLEFSTEDRAERLCLSATSARTLLRRVIRLRSSLLCFGRSTHTLPDIYSFLLPLDCIQDKPGIAGVMEGMLVPLSVEMGDLR
jgi:hypothetical protein